MKNSTLRIISDEIKNKYMINNRNRGNFPGELNVYINDVLIYQERRKMDDNKDQESPCRKQCYINPRTNYCMGCYRSIDEIVKWINLSETEKVIITRKIEKRRIKALKNRSSVNAVWIGQKSETVELNADRSTL
jgi:predicted Fe-S protein YdhL (DUF1289 family)